MRPPRLRCGLFPSIYLPHLLVLPATFGLRRFLPSYPYFPALYVVSVRQVRGLPTASSRFHLTMDTLAVQLCASSLPTRTWDFHPLEPAHDGRTRKKRGGMPLFFTSSRYIDQSSVKGEDALAERIQKRQQPASRRALTLDQPAQERMRDIMIQPRLRLLECLP